jgi:GTP cyclohydrolase III
MRFFFHLHNDLDTRDDEGRELPDEGAALASAREEARVLAAESVREGALNLAHYIAITDATGATVGTVTFGDVVEITPQ